MCSGVLSSEASQYWRNQTGLWSRMASHTDPYEDMWNVNIWLQHHRLWRKMEHSPPIDSFTMHDEQLGLCYPPEKAHYEQVILKLPPFWVTATGVREVGGQEPRFSTSLPGDSVTWITLGSTAPGFVQWSSLQLKNPLTYSVLLHKKVLMDGEKMQDVETSAEHIGWQGKW